MTTEIEYNPINQESVSVTGLRGSQTETLEGKLERWESFKPTTLAQRIHTTLEKVSDQVVGREDLIEQTFYALMSREHQLLYSRAGIAKSLYAQVVFNYFADSRAFTMQMTKQTPEEALVGGLNIEELKHGNYVHMTNDTIVDSKFAFLDELFDGNDNALRSLLGILNEREFRKGRQVEKSSLHTAIATSNYIRANDVTEAVIDRFMFKAYLRPESSVFDMLRIDKAYEQTGGKAQEVSEKIPYDELDFTSSVVQGRIENKKIQIPYHLLFIKNELILDYVEKINKERRDKGGSESELYISPRTIAKARKVLNASALLNGRMNGRLDDLASLRYLVCTLGSPENQEQVFVSSLDSLKQQFSKPSLLLIDRLMEMHELYEKAVLHFKTGQMVDQETAEKLKIFLALPNTSDLTFSYFESTLTQISDSILHPRIAQLKRDLLKIIQEDRKRFCKDSKDCTFLI